MKKFLKISMITSGIICGVGLILMIAGVALGGTFRNVGEMMSEEGITLRSSMLYEIIHEPYTTDDSSAVDPLEDVEEEIYTDEDYSVMGDYVVGYWDCSEVSSLDLEASYGFVNIYYMDGLNQIRVETNEYGREILCQLTDQKLEIDFKDEDWPVNEDVEIYIIIPSNMVFDQVKLSLDAGDIWCDGMTASSVEVDLDAGTFWGGLFDIETQMKIDVDAGEVNIDSLTCQGLDAQCDVGQINIYGCVNGDVTLDTNTGGIMVNLDQSPDNFNYSLKCNIGELILNGQDMSGFGQKHDIDNGALWTLKASCDIGQIDIWFNMP